MHFWSLIFLYIWAGPHHLHYTALPDWAQTLGMVFSIMLWMPSWGGMINGLMTLSGAWDKLRTDPGAALLRHRRRLLRHVDLRGAGDVDPRRSTRSVHYTDWTIGHVHSGALGWVAFITFGAMYYLVPVLWRRERPVFDAAGRLALLDRDARHRALHHLDVGRRHHAGPDVARLRPVRASCSIVRRDPSSAMHPYYVIRMLGGLLFLTGALIMVYNLVMTVAQPQRHRGAAARRCPRRAAVAGE